MREAASDNPAMFENTCVGCPAAHALGRRQQELQESDDQSMRAQMHRAEAPLALEALNRAAGRISCKDIDKSLPPLREDVGDLGSLRLLGYVRKCGAFKQYMKERRRMAQEA